MPKILKKATKQSLLTVSNTIFEVNPSHPRHIFSIAAVILALPSVVQSTYKAAYWTYAKFTEQRMPALNSAKQEYWLTDTKIRAMTFFNIVFSRPTLHFFNQKFRVFLRI